MCYLAMQILCYVLVKLFFFSAYCIAHTLKDLLLSRSLGCKLLLVLTKMHMLVIDQEIIKGDSDHREKKCRPCI